MSRVSVAFQGIEIAHLPNGEVSNPGVIGSLVVAAVFSPGRILAIEKDPDSPERRLRWELDLGELGGRGPVFGEDFAYVSSSRTLRVIEPETGEIVWTWTPYLEEGEWLYTNPVVERGKVLMGDRRGYLWALEARTGRVLWRTLISPEGSNVNATPWVGGDLVVVGSNDGEAVACHFSHGRVLWRQSLGAPCTDRLHMWDGGLLAATWSELVLLDPAEGRILWSHAWPKQHLRSWCVVGDWLLVNVDNKLSGFYRREIAYSGIQLYPISQLCYHPVSRRVYEVGHEGLSILEPETGQRLGTLEPREFLRGTGPPGYADGVLYLMTESGVIMSVIHPDLESESANS